MKDRVPTYPGRVKLTPVSGQANTYDMERADQPVQEGTPLNKANLLTDETAAKVWPDSSTRPSNPSVNDAMAQVADAIVSGAKIQTGSYVGTGTYGEANPCVLTFDFEPSMVVVGRINHGLLPKDNYFSGSFVWINQQRTSFTDSSMTTMFDKHGNSLSWYNSNGASSQLNLNGNTYSYVCLG